jgi:PAS domain S-box-containing protein
MTLVPADSVANLLLIDDDAKSLLAMEGLLAGPGRTIVTAQSGREALRCLLKQDFALILLDVRLPEMDGFETAALIRQRERSRYTPIIFLSAVDTLESDVLKGVASGAVDYLFKPVVPQVLRSKVSVFVDLFHLNERLKRQAIRQSEERFRLLVESMQDYAILMLDSEGRVTSWNTGAERIKGFTQEEILGESFACFYTPEDRNLGHPARALERAAADGRYEQEAWRVRKDGSRFWGNIIVAALRDDEGHLLGFSEVTRDLTERKRTEEALRVAEEHLRAVVTNAPIILFALDKAGVFTLLEGKGWQGVPGLTRDGAPSGRSAIEVFRDVPHLVSGIESALKGDPSTSSGEIGGRWFEISLTPMRDEWGRVVGVSGVALDVTEQRRAEEEVFRASKMESIGVLAGGIAHDFNNILTAIIGNLTLAKMQLEPQHTAFQRLTDSEKAVLRAKSLTQQLLTFARGGKPIKQSLAVGHLLKESAEFALQGSNVRCELSIANNLWTIEADPGQVNQVVNNLVLNAQQAMPDGGVLRIEAGNLVVGFQDNLPLAPGQYVRIRITDSGNGIAPEHLEKIFDPFFTTKAKGTGLGLTTAYWIIKRHRGYIAIDSKIGIGTSVSVYLSKSEKEAVPETPRQEALIRGSGRILFMDDEGPIREYAADVLSQLGYDAVCARDGAEAIEIFREAEESGRPFTAVILDLTVRAGMGGKETIQRLIEMDPDIKAIVSSGYSNDPVLADFKEHGFAARVAKPYTAEDLSRILAALSTHPAGRRARAKHE